MTATAFVSVYSNTKQTIAAHTDAHSCDCVFVCCYFSASTSKRIRYFSLGYFNGICQIETDEMDAE